MNKLTLAQKLADRVGITIGLAEEVVTAIFGGRRSTGILPETVLAGDRLVIEGFGSFVRRQRRGRPAGVNIHTGAPKVGPTKRVIRFRPARALAERMA